jgi:hypothetical protein
MSETSSEFEFDPSTEEGSHFDLIPKGYYKAEVVDASLSTTKNGKGTMLNLTWQLDTDGGDYDRRFVFSHILTQHESVDAMRFGRQRVKDLCVACGITEAITDVSVFKYKPCTIYVGIEQDKTGEYPDKNKVSRIQPLVVLNAPSPPSPSEKNTPIDDEITF